ncbi:MAG: hypothetical protein RQ761_05310 [Bacteroidales bacterium]|nr:hypothetical protein [Bacteroidales bacterium]
MKKILLLTFVLLFTAAAYSQHSQYEDVVYLKNGSVVRGMIVEQIPNQTLKIKTVNRNIFVYSFDEIEKITREEVPAEAVVEDFSRSWPEEKPFIKKKGFESTVDIGLGGILDWGGPALSLNMVVGYRFFPQFFLGGGTGLEFYENRSMLPIFFNVRTDFVEARVTPFFAANAGYAFGWLNYEDGSDWGGVFIEPSIGIRFNFSSSFGLNLSTGLKFQKVLNSNDIYPLNYPPGDYYEHTYSETYRLFLFKVGFSF